MMFEDTIVAVATPPGRGGVAIIRISGEQALAIASILTRKKNISPRTSIYSSIHDRSDVLLDSGIIIYYAGPHSFTGEDVIELQMHGSPVVLDAIVNECIYLGARIAQAGEFSKRAFLNNKLDLVQAEAIADLIDAHSLKAATMASRSLQGEFSRQIELLNSKIIQLRLYVEASIDFPEEEIDFISEGAVSAKLADIISNLNDIMAHTSQGILIREGLNIVIAGRPNAGKSTLINALAKDDIAIVTDIAGTTRDVMRAHVLMGDIPVHILDTAGLHDSADPVEQEGIKRAWKAISTADCVIHLKDMSLNGDDECLNQQLKDRLPVNTPIIEVNNKVDIAKKADNTPKNGINISAKTHQGIETLIDTIKTLCNYLPEEGLFIARRRHLNALERSFKSLTEGTLQLQNHKAGELLAEDLRHAHEALCEITGEFTSDDLLGEIFSTFCIGK